MMHLEKCLLRIKVVRLLVIIGAFSSIAVFLIYSMPNSDKETATIFNQGLFNVWPIKTTNLLHLNGGKSNGRPTDYSQKHHLNILFRKHQNQYLRYNIDNNHQNHVLRNKIKRLTVDRLQSDDAMVLVNATKALPKHAAQNIHIFYTIAVDWMRQQQLAPPSSPSQQQQPPSPTAFYPLLGFYAPDNQTIRHHLKNIAMLGANVLIVTWSPACQEQLLWSLFDDAPRFGIRIAIEIDNYINRTVFTIFNDIQYFYKEFWQHQSLYKVYVSSKQLFMPMIYIKHVDSMAANEWKKLLSTNGEITLRSAAHDAIFIGHISARKDVSIIKTSQFNGFYSRMVSNGATYASTWKYWMELKKSADKFKLVFIPTVGPGYDANSKIPNIAAIRRHRTNGQYYGVAWRAAIATGAEFINIASYNDWTAGTQIEEAVPRSGYKDYSPGTPTKYIDLTRYWINEYIRSWQTDTIKRIVNANLCSSYFNNTVC